MDNQTGFNLWYRPDRLHKWRVVGHAETSVAATGLIAKSTLHGGHWYTAAAQVDPNSENPRNTRAAFENPAV